MTDKIMITCPVKLVPIITGFKAPLGTTLTGLKRVKLQICPACGQSHVWNGEDAYWGEEEPDPSFMDVVRSFWSRSKPGH